MVQSWWSQLEQVMSYRADKLGDGRTDGWMQATTIPEGQYWPQVKTMTIWNGTCGVLTTNSKSNLWTLSWKQFASVWTSFVDNQVNCKIEVVWPNIYHENIWLYAIVIIKALIGLFSKRIQPENTNKFIISLSRPFLSDNYKNTLKTKISNLIINWGNDIIFWSPI